MDRQDTRLRGGQGLIPERFLGIALISFAFLCFAALDTTAKYLGQTLPSQQIVWMRFLTHVLYAVIAFRLWRDLTVFRTRRWGLQFARALCLMGSTLFNFFAVRYLQLAETVSIMFAAPFVVTALAGPLLNEWAGMRRWIAVIVGFCGVLVVTRPGAGGLHWAVILSVGSMLCYALYALMTRMLARTESPMSLLVISGAIATLAMMPAGVMAWTPPPDWLSWVLLLSTGFWGGLGHLALIRAHILAPAAVLAPFMYTQILWMIAFGYAVFADVPTIYTLVGASIVVGSGLYILYREQKVARQERAAAAVGLTEK